MDYKILRTETADETIRQIVLYIAQNFSRELAEKKLNELEAAIKKLSTNPYPGPVPKYRVLKNQGYRVLVLEKDMVFYKVNDVQSTVMIYAVVDQRQDYLSIIKGL